MRFVSELYKREQKGEEERRRFQCNNPFLRLDPDTQSLGEEAHPYNAAAAPAAGVGAGAAADAAAAIVVVVVVVVVAAVVVAAVVVAAAVVVVVVVVVVAAAGVAAAAASAKLQKHHLILEMEIFTNGPPRAKAITVHDPRSLK